MGKDPQILYTLIGWEQHILCDFFEQRGDFINETRDYVFTAVHDIGKWPAPFHIPKA